MYGKLQEAALTEIIPLICTLTLQRDYPLLSHPESPQGVPLWWLQYLRAGQQAVYLTPS